MDQEIRLTLLLMEVKVSVLVPNYNKAKYIYERLESIKNQTYPDWELIIIDGYSDDGSWEIIKEYSKSIKNPIQILQLPRKGIYDAINECIKRSSGKYIYIATSDDLMSRDCLSKMVDALQEHPQCGICSSCLNIIDEDGNEIKNKWSSFNSSKFYGSLLTKKHIRYAPYDSILQCFIYNTFSSLTQILIRKEVFNEVGLFNNNFGSAGDLEWQMRATLKYNTIHLPDYLSSWRHYAGQATNSQLFTTLEGQYNFLRIINSVHSTSEAIFNNNKIKISMKELTFCNRFQVVAIGFRETTCYGSKLFHIIRSVIKYPDIMKHLIYLKLSGKQFSRVALAKHYSQRLNISNHITCL